MSRGDRSRQGRERTAEERERDRQERARRRAARAGNDPAAPAEHDAGHTHESGPSTPLPDLVPPPDLAPHTPEDPAPHAPEELADAPPPPVHEEPATSELATLPAASPLPPEAFTEPATPDVESAAPDVESAARDPEPAAGDPEHVSRSDEPAAVAPTSVAAASSPLPEPPPRLSARGARRADASAGRRADARSGGRARRSRRSLLARVGAVLALAAAIAAVILLLSSLLSSKHAKPVSAPAVVKVVVPEGETRAQIAQIASKAGLRGSYTAASRHSPLLNPAHYGAPHGTATLEGFLFPATYDEYPGAPASRLVADQLTAFKENFGSALSARARSLHVTPYQLLTVASMIEREAQVPADRAKIAAVIYNRLQQEIPLGIDATIYYAVELQKGIATYTGELTESQLHINSPYNTRTHVGLPPTPISNPGIASIEAAANPAHASYLYYVAGADGCGEQVFSTTLAAFEANVAAYQAAVKKNGGHPPTCKK